MKPLSFCSPALRALLVCSQLATAQLVVPDVSSSAAAVEAATSAKIDIPLPATKRSTSASANSSLPTVNTFTFHPIDKPTLERFLYTYAVSSAAAGVGSVMATFNSTAWCMSPENVYWCPDALNHTIADIARKVIATTRAENNSVVRDGCDRACMVQGMDRVSRRAAAAAMWWAKMSVNGSSTDIDAAKRVDWSIWRITHGNATVANSTAVSNQDSLTSKNTKPSQSPKGKRDDSGKKDADKKAAGKKAAIAVPAALGIPGLAFAGYRGYKWIVDNGEWDALKAEAIAKNDALALDAIKNPISQELKDNAAEAARISGERAASEAAAVSREAAEAPPWQAALKQASGLKNPARVSEEIGELNSLTKGSRVTPRPEGVSDEGWNRYLDQWHSDLPVTNYAILETGKFNPAKNKWVRIYDQVPEVKVPAPESFDQFVSIDTSSTDTIAEGATDAAGPSGTTDGAFDFEVPEGVTPSEAWEGLQDAAAHGLQLPESAPAHALAEIFDPVNSILAPTVVSFASGVPVPAGLAAQGFEAFQHVGADGLTSISYHRLDQLTAFDPSKLLPIEGANGMMRSQSLNALGDPIVASLAKDGSCIARSLQRIGTRATGTGRHAWRVFDGLGGFVKAADGSHELIWSHDDHEHGEKKFSASSVKAGPPPRKDDDAEKAESEHVQSDQAQHTASPSTVVQTSAVTTTVTASSTSDVRSSRALSSVMASASTSG